MLKKLLNWFMNLLNVFQKYWNLLNWYRKSLKQYIKNIRQFKAFLKNYGTTNLLEKAVITYIILVDIGNCLMQVIFGVSPFTCAYKGKCC